MLDKLDITGSVTHRLYRQHTVPMVKNGDSAQLEGSRYVKDLERIGRDLRRMIIVDNLKENYCW